MTSQKKAIALALVLLVIVAVVATWFIRSGNKTVTGDSHSATANIAEGIHYQSIKSPLASNATKTPGNKVSVVEFFWYGCPHCRDFEPSVRKWLASAPEDVAFRQIPVVWNEATTLHASLFYVAEGADNAGPLHDKLFKNIIALRQERNLASQLEQLAVLYTDHGIDAGEVKGLVEAAQIRANVAESETLMRQAEVSSTPTVLVDGRWAVLNNEAVGKAGGTFTVVDFLVQKARAMK